MEKRILLAVSLSFVVLVGYQALLPPIPPEDVPAADSRTVTPPAARTTTPLSPDRRVSDDAVARPFSSAPFAPPVTSALEDLAPPTVTDTAERTTVLENEAVRAVFSNRGAVLESWQLKPYLDEAGQPHELVPTLADALKPFSLSVDDAAVTNELASALYRVTAFGRTGSEAGALVFEYETDTITARKEFRFEPSPHEYVVVVSVTVLRNGEPLRPTVHWGPGLAGKPSSDQRVQASEAIILDGGKPVRVSAAKIVEQPTREGVFGFLGIDDHYFASVVLPDGHEIRGSYDTVSIPPTDPEAAPQALVAYGVTSSQAPLTLRFFVGPKDFDILEATHPDLVRTINFGFFGFLAVPLLRALKWINGPVGNYGWSIIILTILINAVMFPLRHKSVVSMRKMQEIQPEVKAIQDRYANLKATDPAKQKMNAEVMNLYRERGVNPASGCLPMLLTMPVLFAFYSLLSVAIEIRGAPFIFWITDLSAHDPLYITPIVMGVTMVWQQMRTPSTADPTQQKVMMFMPLIFTFMFLWASSGLVLYWLCSNLWGIGQQEITNRIIGPPPVRVVRPPAERRTRKVGRGQSTSPPGDSGQ